MAQAQLRGQAGEVLVVGVVAHVVIEPLAQFQQVRAGRAQAQYAAAGGEDAHGFVPVDGAEHAGDQLATGVGQRQPGHARHQPGQLRRAAAGAFHCLAGDVQGIAFGAGQGFAEPGAVVALAATDIQPASRRAFGGQFGQAPGKRRVVAGAEELATGLDHGGVVARIKAFLVLHRQQVQVALAGAVEAVPGGAGDAVVDLAQGGGAERADQHQASSLTRVW